MTARVRQYRLRISWQGGGRRFESVRGLREAAANQALLLGLVLTVSDPDVHRASTVRWERLPRGRETVSWCGFTALWAGVHPASTARSRASASRSDTACSWLSTARWP